MPTVPHFESLTGTIDGVNTVFTASSAYIAGSTVVFLRAIPRIITNDDGWVETDPSTGIVTLNEAPLVDDDLQMSWNEAVGADLITGPLCGALQTSQPLSGRISTITSIFGKIED